MQFHVTSLLYYWPAAAKSSSLTSSHHSMCLCHLCHQVQQSESCSMCCFSKPISGKNSTSFPTYLWAKPSCGPLQSWTCCRAGSKAPGEGWVVGDQECPFPPVNTTPKVKEHPLIKECCSKTTTAILDCSALISLPPSNRDCGQGTTDGFEGICLWKFPGSS